MQDQAKNKKEHVTLGTEKIKFTRKSNAHERPGLTV